MAFVKTDKRRQSRSIFLRRQAWEIILEHYIELFDRICFGILQQAISLTPSCHRNIRFFTFNIRITNLLFARMSSVASDDALVCDTNLSHVNKDSEEQPHVWIHEYLTPFDAYHHGIRSFLCAKQTAYQSMAIVDTGVYGKALFLDGKIQTAANDEAYYHEPLVHAPAVAYGAPKSFLVLGGADGGAIREALRWNSAEQVTLVDIDGDVIDACQRYLPEIHKGALQDPRVELAVQDAADFIAEGAFTKKYDVIVCDLTDPMENSPSLGLFTREFFQSLLPLLSSSKSTVALQAGPASLVENATLFPRICATLRSVFAHVAPYQIYAPTYGSPLGMAVASNEPINLPEPQMIDQTFKSTIEGEMSVLDGRALHAHFGIPRCVSKAINAETRVYTKHETANAFGQGTLGS